MTIDRFPICWPYTLAEECPFPKDWSNPKNFSNDPHDPGGETMCGIIQREYDMYRHLKGLEPQDVRSISKTEGEEIYRGYWRHCELLPAGLDMEFFDTAVNMGRTRATKILQYVLGITWDGLWGPQTAAAAAGVNDVKSVIDRYTEHRLATYKTLSGWQYFGTGWTNRDVKIGIISDHMVSGVTPPAPQPIPPTQPRTPRPRPTPVPPPTPAPPVPPTTPPQPPTRTWTMGDSLGEIEQALLAANNFLPLILSQIGMFYPPAAALSKFLPLINVAIQGVDTVAKATGQPPAAAAGAVIAHLTPGAPDAAALK